MPPHVEVTIITTLRPLNAPELHALKIIAKQADDARSQLVAGKVALDFGVHIVGDLIVNADGEFLQPQKPTATTLVAALLNQFGPRKRQMIVDELLRTGLIAASKDEATVVLADRLIDGLTIREMAKRRGAVTGKFDLQLVEVR